MDTQMDNCPPTHADASSRRESGFTLVELMVVIVILGGLVALVGPKVWQALFVANEETAKTQMSEIGKALNLYAARNGGKLPQSLDQLTEEDPRSGEAWLDVIPDDPWGGRYEYRRESNRKYKLVSAGDDGNFDTDDDIIYPFTNNKD